MNLKALKPLLHFALVIGIALAAASAWVAIFEYRARSAAQEFCAGIKPGEAEAALLSRALAAGADATHTRIVQPLVGPRWLAATFTGYSAASRHLCVVTVEEGHAKEARYEHE